MFLNRPWYLRHKRSCSSCCCCSIRIPRLPGDEPQRRRGCYIVVLVRSHQPGGRSPSDADDKDGSDADDAAAAAFAVTVEVLEQQTCRPPVPSGASITRSLHGVDSSNKEEVDVDVLIEESFVSSSKPSHRRGHGEFLHTFRQPCSTNSEIVCRGMIRETSPLTSFNTTHLCCASLVASIDVKPRRRRRRPSRSPCHPALPALRPSSPCLLKPIPYVPQRTRRSPCGSREEEEAEVNTFLHS